MSGSGQQKQAMVAARSAKRKGDRVDSAAGTDRTQREMEAVLRISRSLAGKLGLKDILAAALNTVGNLAGAEGASILLIDPQTEQMSFYIAEGPGGEAAKRVALPPGAGICGHVVRTGDALIVNDAQNDPRLYRPVDKATGMVTANLLCVPIRSEERMWGVLELINKHAGEGFDNDDLRLAEVIAGQIALGLANSHLHQKIVRNERMAAIGQTVSGLAHCIKNILNGIRSGSAVLDRALVADDRDRLQQGWHTVSRNNEMLSSLVLDMLALARDSQPHPFPTDVNDMTKQVCELLNDNAAERGLSLECIEASDLPEAMLDATHFYRCLLNLVSNGLDACKEGGHVRVRVYRGKERERFTVSVTDNGEGISPENRKRLFGEFFTTKGGRGTGLGLPVTKKLIGQMAGEITFHSAVGYGTRFVMALPVGDSDNL